jgi:hypothetical protein
LEYKIYIGSQHYFSIIINESEREKMNKTLFELSSCILFWKYYKEKESYERDQKLYNCYSELLVSNIVLGVALMGLIIILGLLFGSSGTVTEFLLKANMILCAVHYFLQYFTGLDIYRRVKRVKMKAAIEDAKAAFKAIFGENENTENDHQNFKGKFSDYFEDVFNQEYSELDEISKILNKFDLPTDTRDMVIIKKRYRQLAKKFHPDMANGNADLFKQLVLDFEILKYYFEVENVG